MKILVSLFVLMAITPISQAQTTESKPIPYSKQIPTAEQRRSDIDWMHIDLDTLVLIKDGINVQNNRQTKMQDLEIQTVSIAQPMFWAVYGQDQSKYMAPMIFTLKFNGKSWTGSSSPLEKGTLNITTYALISANDHSQISFLEFQGFNDTYMSQKLTRDMHLNIKVDRDFLSANANPSLQAYFATDAVKSLWQRKISVALNYDFCFKFQPLTEPTVCKLKAKNEQ